MGYLTPDAKVLARISITKNHREEHLNKMFVLRNLPLRLEYLRVRWFNKQSGLYLSLFSLYFVRSFVHHNRSKRSTQNYNAH